MAVDEAIGAVVLDVIGQDPVLVVDVVIDELTYRKTVTETADLAQAALERMPSTWKEVDTAKFVELERVRDAQADVADGRPLKDDRQHWAESTIIALGRKAAEDGTSSAKVVLSEDFDARRVASRGPHMTGVSIHGLLHALVQGNTMTAVRAAELAKLLQDAGRAGEVLEEDFADPSGRRLGRVGRPAFRL
jgi:hypothetical protein